MRILVLTHSYCPANDPRAFRWGAICETWAARGITVDVVCAYAKADLPNSEQINGVNIYRVKDPSQRFRTIDLENNHDGLSVTSWRSKFKQSLHGLLKKIVILLRWPDFSWLWIPRAYRKTSFLLKNNQYAGIYSVALPFSSHFVILCMGKKRNNIPWICDYGDPFSFLKMSPINNYRLYSGLNRYIEQKVMQVSQKISVTTSETAKQYIDYLKVQESWFHMIPPLYKSSNIMDTNEQLLNFKTIDAPIRLVFAGTLYEKIRNPGFLLALLSKTKSRMIPKKLEIHFYGPIGDCTKEFETYQDAINVWIFLHGSVDKAELSKIYAEADVLVNIGNATSYQAPSKVIEYISTGLPILNITSISADSSIPMLDLYASALTLEQQNGVSEEAISTLCTFLIKKQKVSRNVINKVLKPYQCEIIADSYLQLLN